MNTLSKTLGFAAAVSCVLAFAGSVNAGTASDQKGSHSHIPATTETKTAADAKKDDIRDRALSDWAGVWQSVYPYLMDGTLEPVMAKKATKGDKSAAEYRAYYEAGYKTDVNRIDINGQYIRFFRGKDVAAATYDADGYEIITYTSGGWGVRYIFKKIRGDDAAPGFIAFSDHTTVPKVSDHYHLYSSNDRATLLKEIDNWPTYYPARLDAKGIVEEMLAH